MFSIILLLSISVSSLVCGQILAMQEVNESVIAMHYKTQRPLTSAEMEKCLERDKASKEAAKEILFGIKKGTINASKLKKAKPQQSSWSIWSSSTPSIKTEPVVSARAGALLALKKLTQDANQLTLASGVIAEALKEANTLTTPEVKVSGSDIEQLVQTLAHQETYVDQVRKITALTYGAGLNLSADGKAAAFAALERDDLRLCKLYALVFKLVTDRMNKNAEFEALINGGGTKDYTNTTLILERNAASKK